METSDVLSSSTSSKGCDPSSSEDRWLDDGGQGEVYEEEPVDSALRYPLYVIANDLGVLVSNVSGKDCVLLFHRKEFAERHIAQAMLAGPLYPLAISDADAFRQGLESLPPEINCAIWDATVVPREFIYIEVVDLFRALENA